MPARVTTIIAGLLIALIGWGTRATAQPVCSGAGAEVLTATCRRAEVPPSWSASRGEPPPSSDEHEDDDSPRDGAPSACALVYSFTFDPADPAADPTINLSGRRQDLYEFECNGVYMGYYEWVDAPLGGPPAISASDLVPGVWVSVSRRLPRPVPRIAPVDVPGRDHAFVQMSTFFWVEQVQGQWARVTGSASAGGITVSVEAMPRRLIVDPGDGEQVVCEGAPPAFVAGNNPSGFRGCEHTYRDSSAMAANGETFPVRVSIEWSASWSASTGEGGSLGTRRTTSETRWLPVAEIQAVLIDRDG